MVIHMNLNDQYLEGARYFIYLMSEKISPYIDTELRRLIWSFIITPPYTLCEVSNSILRLNLKYNEI